MKQLIERILTAVIWVIVAIPLTFFVVNTVRIKVRMHSLKNANHAAILAACRDAIEHRSEYRNDKDQWGTLHDNEVLVLDPLSAAIPEPLRKLNPDHLLIRDRHIIVGMNLPFCRLNLIAFPAGADEYGTFKYIDGLWFWNGNFESEEMRNRVYEKASKKQNGQPAGGAYGSPAAGEPYAHP